MDQLEGVRDNYNQEAYENISGEILARDVEQGYNTHSSLNNVINQMADPKSDLNNLPAEEYDEVMGRASTQTPLATTLHPRDAGNSYPHNMQEVNPMTNPYVMMNAMEARHDNYGIQDEDTINAYYDADSLFEEAYKEMQRRNK